MRILIVGKYPPIQGGVSRRVHSTAEALAARGHEVHVLTNANEVDAGFRQRLSSANRRSIVSGEVRVWNVEGISERAYLPSANPFVSKLFGLGISIAKETKPDLVIGWYFEPYGMAAAHIALASNIPYYLCHAGSDLGRLAQHPNLRPAYSWMLERAARILSSGRSNAVRSMLEGLTPLKGKLVELPITRIESMFGMRCGDERAVVESYHSDFPDWALDLGLNADLLRTICSTAEQSIDWSQPVISCYGKVGEVKGSFDLITALIKLAGEGVPFTFISASGGWHQPLEEYYRRISSSTALLARTKFLPLIAPWDVPALLASSQLVCFLERKFPIEFHGPRVPREALASGACLVCSEEIIRKQPFVDSLVHGKNVVRISDPQDIDTLTQQLRALICEPQTCSVIGKHGQYLSLACERFFHPEPIAAAIENTPIRNLPG